MPHRFMAQAAGQPQAALHRLGDDFPELDGRSAKMVSLKRHMSLVARDGRVGVLILGESGTGKELIARAIHRASPRSAGPFIVINCAGLSSTLIEDELFGHVRGAFTGATNDRAGPFERAHRGTVFLDEVGDLSSDSQMKLLRALQQRTVQRLGDDLEHTFDVRVIAATNVDLAAVTATGRFREDLYFRLNVYALHVPPLRERHEDIEVLALAIVRELGAERRRPHLRLAPEVLRAFTHYRWPGNVRELENVVERMIVVAGSDELLTTRHLPDDFGTALKTRSRPLPSVADAMAALVRHESKRSQTAAELGLSRHQLYRLIKGAPGLTASGDVRPGGAAPGQAHPDLPT